MHSDLYLRIAGLLATYVLQITIVYICCLALSRLCDTPRWRFVFWQTFTVGAGAYWLAVLRAGFFPGINSANNFQPAGSLLPEPLQIPGRSAHMIATAETVVAWLYLGCVIFFLLRLAANYLKVWLALQRSTHPEDGISKLFFQMRRVMGLDNCELLILPGLASPAAACFWRPKILLPAGTEQLGDENAMADVLWHELAHVRRRDYLWACVSDLIRCFVFFHPAIWQARKQLRLQRELACDQAVIADQPGHRADYAECLTRFARFKMLQDAEELGIDFAASPSLLAIRINSLLKEPQRKSFCKEWIKMATGSLVTSLAFFSLPFLVVALGFAPQSEAFNIGSQIATGIHGKQPLKSTKFPHARRSSGRLRTNVPSADSPISAVEESAYQGKPPYTADGASGETNLQADQADASGPTPSSTSRPVWSETAPNTSPSPGKQVTEKILVALGQIIVGGRDGRKDGDDRHFTTTPMHP
jgi:beta-lactamase regulating signal transducer with metallopeptidase domain